MDPCGAVPYFIVLCIYQQKGTTESYTRPDRVLWTDPIPTSDCSSLKEEAISRCSSFAGLILAKPFCFPVSKVLDAFISICVVGFAHAQLLGLLHKYTVVKFVIIGSIACDLKDRIPLNY